MDDEASNGDDAYQSFELKIISGITPNEKDFLCLKRAIAKENHENAKWLLGILGIQQDSEKIIITRFDQALEILRTMASSSIPTSTTLDGHHPRQKQIMEMNGLQRQILYGENTFNGMALEQVDGDADVCHCDGCIDQLAISFALKEPTKLRRVSKKICKIFKNTFTRKR